jgi:type II secretory pathway component GspD/PulD (secretin)
MKTQAPTSKNLLISLLALAPIALDAQTSPAGESFADTVNSIVGESSTPAATPTITTPEATTPAPADPASITIETPTATTPETNISIPTDAAPASIEVGTGSAGTPEITIEQPAVGAAGGPAPIDPSTDVGIITPGTGTGTDIGALPTTSTVPGEGQFARRAREFEQEDLNIVLRSLARQAGITVVVSDLVVGTVSLRVENKTPMETIEIIAKSKGLVITQEGDVYYIKTPAEQAQEPQTAAYYTFSYARASEVAPLVQAQLASGAAPVVDSRTNTLFYRELQSKVEDIKSFLDLLDRPTKQVMIETRLVETNYNPQQDYGIDWSGTFAGKEVALGGGPFGTIEVDEDGTTTTTYEFLRDTQGNPILSNFVGAMINPLDLLNGEDEGVSTQNPYLNGDKGPTPLGGQFAILNLPQFSATIDLINRDEDSELLSNPRIVTADNVEANIKITRKEPVPQLNFNEQTATAVFGGFTNKEYGNTLIVLPQVNKDNYITLSVKPEISSKVGDSAFTFAGAVVTSPIIDTRSLESKVIIKSGDTLAVGGLMQDQVNKSEVKIPILGDVPLVGYLFRHEGNTRQKRNLLIFVTPTILDDRYYTGFEDQANGFTNRQEVYADPRGWRNNAKGEIRLIPTDTRHIAADSENPGLPIKTQEMYKLNAASATGTSTTIKTK